MIVLARLLRRAWQRIACDREQAINAVLIAGLVLSLAGFALAVLR